MAGPAPGIAATLPFLSAAIAGCSSCSLYQRQTLCLTSPRLGNPADRRRCRAVPAPARSRVSGGGEGLADAVGDRVELDSRAGDVLQDLVGRQLLALRPELAEQRARLPLGPASVS